MTMRFTLAVGAVVCSAANDIAGDGGDHTGGWLRPLIWAGELKARKCYTSRGPKRDRFFKRQICTAARVGSSYAQLGQDLIVSYLLGCIRGGYFVDLAANDAIVHSNTAGLEATFGWQGLCVEPNPTYWAGFGQRRCKLVGAVVTKEDNEMVQFVFDGVKGTMHARNGQHEQLPSLSMRTLLLSVGAPRTIDYMSLDVEGAETAVMQGFPFDAGFTIRVLSVERPDVALEQLLVENGMTRVGAIGKMGEVIFIQASDLDVASRARNLAETISKSTPFYPGLSDGSNLIFPGA